jgi:hypothetical protein
LSHKSLFDASLYLLLVEIDREFAAAVRALGCDCGGVLHSARYRRKPRGGPEDLDDEYGYRFSFCCAEEGCRCRLTPRSVRYLGRRVYLGVVVVLLCVMTEGVTPRRARKLREELGVSRRTLERWRRWWQEAFPASRFFSTAKARLMPPVDESRLPASLLERFQGGCEWERLVGLLRFLSPMTTGGL